MDADAAGRGRRRPRRHRARRRRHPRPRLQGRQGGQEEEVGSAQAFSLKKRSCSISLRLFTYVNNSWLETLPIFPYFNHGPGFSSPHCVSSL